MYTVNVDIGILSCWVNNWHPLLHQEGMTSCHSVALCWREPAEVVQVSATLRPPPCGGIQAHREKGDPGLERTLEQTRSTLAWQHLQSRRSWRIHHDSSKIVSRGFQGHGGPVVDTIVISHSWSYKVVGPEPGTGSLVSVFPTHFRQRYT